MYYSIIASVAFLLIVALIISQVNFADASSADTNVKTALSTSPGGHYIQYSGKTLMLIGDSGTQCIMQNLNLDYRQWIDDCAQRGLTAVQVWALVAPRQKRDGSVLEDRYGYVYPGATPWVRRADGLLATDGWTRWDLTRFDEGDDPSRHYWPRLRDLCSYAKQRNIIVGITVFFGWPKHNSQSRPDWSYHPFNIANGCFLSDPMTDRYGTTATQIIYSPGTEVLQEHWSEDWPPAKKTQWVWEQYASKLIQETKGYGNMFFVFMDEHSYSEGNCGDHFLSFFKKRGAVYVDWEHRRAAVDFVHDDARDPEGNGNSGAVAAFAKTPIRPNICLEAPPYQGEVVRRSIWSRLMGGLHFILHNDSGQETVTTGIMVYDPNVQGANREKVMERLDWLGHASRFFNHTVHDLDFMVPHNELINSAEDSCCLANPGTEYAIYSWSEESFQLDLSAADGKRVMAQFYNPRTGQWGDPVKLMGGNKEKFEKPDDRDWVFYVKTE